MQKNSVAVVTEGEGEDDMSLLLGPTADFMVGELSCVCGECPIMTRLLWR